MEVKERTTDTVQPAPAVDKLYMENTLLRVSGALFSHDPKRAAKSLDCIVLNQGIDHKAIIVEPHPNHGRPGPLAHKVFVAIIKKHSDYGRPVPSEVSFSRRELMRLAGRTTWGGRDSAEFSEALQQIHKTFITTQFRDKGDRWIEESFNIFPRILIARKSSPTDPIEACIVTLADPIVASLKDEHFTCLNHGLMQKLGTIGQALYLRLFFHLKNLHDGRHDQRLKFEKRYDDICAEWLGGLTVHSKKSLIEREQLGRHLRQLVEAGFLASYAIEKASTGDSGFKIVFRPGETFFADYDRFYRHRRQGGLQFDFNGDQRQIAEPLKVAYLFQEKRTGQPLKLIPYVSSKEVETAKQILEQVSFAEIPAFLDYARAEAARTKFDVQSLGGVKQYLASYLASRDRRAASTAATAARQQRTADEALQAAYIGFRRSRAKAIFQSLSAEERASIAALAKGGSKIAFSAKTGSLGSLMLELDIARITAERHPDRIPTLEQWQAKMAA